MKTEESRIESANIFRSTLMSLSGIKKGITNRVEPFCVHDNEYRLTINVYRLSPYP
jgi:hypothetical protein